MELYGRLKKIASLVKGADVLADVGCDHGYIPIFCVQSGLAKKAIAMDINKGPLLNCTDNIVRYKLSDKIETRLSNGIEGLNKGEADYIVIAGMGGLLIKDILNAGISKIEDGCTLILQPMLAQIELREYLYKNGFNIEDEYLEREEDKFYNILKVKKVSSPVKFTYNDIYVGKNLKFNSTEFFEEYIKHKIYVTQKILDGLNMAQIKDEERINYHLSQLKVYKEVL